MICCCVALEEECSYQHFPPFPFLCFCLYSVQFAWVLYIFHIVISTCFNFNEQHFMNKHICSRLHFASQFVVFCDFTRRASKLCSHFIYFLQLNFVDKNKQLVYVHVVCLLYWNRSKRYISKYKFLLENIKLSFCLATLETAEIWIRKN